MLGGLFGDLPPPSQQSASGAPTVAPVAPLHVQSPPPVVAPAATAAAAVTAASAAKKAAAATPRKAPAILAPPPSVLRHQQQQQQQQQHSKPKVPVRPASSSSTVVAQTGGRWADPPADAALAGTGTGSSATASALLAGAKNDVSQVQVHSALVAATASVVDEYDPARPNDYEDYCRERKRRKMEDEMKREMQKRRLEDEEREREREITRQRELERQKELEKEVHITGEEAWKRRGMLSNNRPPPQRSPSPPASGKPSSSGNQQQQQQQQPQQTMTAAQRMMARMGWKEGQGLGKQEQGITTALVARKTDKRAGVIVNAGEVKKQKHAPPPPPPPPPTTTTLVPTKVVLLRNMVGPGEVDGELEDEVASECGKFGVVTGVLIYEIIEPDFSPTEAVRIFIQFERPEQASKALTYLDGRFFGGRVVKASFFDEERFTKRELAPGPGE